MNHDALLRETERLEQELGPCLLLVKCYELLGDRPAVARKTAQHVLRGELDRLGRVIDKGFGFSQRSEQFLRAIYALSVAGQDIHATSTFTRFLLDARDLVHRQGALSGEDAFRTAIGQVIVASHAENAITLLAPDSLGAWLLRAWWSGSTDELREFADQIDDLIEAAENDGVASPSNDGWLYILQIRLSNRLGRREA